MSGNDEKTARRFFLVLLVAAAALLGAVILPIASALFMGAVLAGVLWPVKEWMVKRFKVKPGVAAGLLTFWVVVLIVGPLISLSVFVIREGSAAVTWVSETVRSEGVTGLIHRLPEPLERAVNWLIGMLPQKPGGGVAGSLSDAGGTVSAAAVRAVSATGSMIFQAAMMLIAFFSLLVQGRELVDWLDAAAPLRPGQTRELLANFKRVAYAVIVSTVITAGVQAAAALAGYLIAGVPHPIFFTALTFFVAFIPAVGAASVCLAAAVLLYFTDHTGMAIFLAAWGMLVVGLVDNIIKPLLIKRGMEMQGTVVFFALIGGLAAFGAVGLILGPLIVAAFMSLVKMHQRDYQGEGGSQPVASTASAGSD